VIKVKPEQIKFIMKMKKLSLVQMAMELGVTRQTIHGIMSGKPVSGKLIGRLIQYSGLDFSDIFFIDDITLASNKNFVSNPSDLPQDKSFTPRKGKSSSRQKSSVLRGNKEAHEKR